jgi:hypothetical protein
VGDRQVPACLRSLPITVEASDVADPARQLGVREQREDLLF